MAKVADDELNEPDSTIVDPIELTEDQLNQLICNENRFHHFHDVETYKEHSDEALEVGDVIHVKQFTSHTWIKETQWNSDRVRSCWKNSKDCNWTKEEDREPINNWRYLNSDHEISCVIVVHRECYIAPHSCIVKELGEDDSQCTMMQTTSWYQEDHLPRHRHLSSPDMANQMNSMMWNSIASS